MPHARLDVLSLFGLQDPSIARCQRLGMARLALTVLRNPDRGTMTLSLEVPIEDGQLLTKALKPVLFSRDRGCAFPGCHRSRFVEAHHSHHRIDGGERRASTT